MHTWQCIQRIDFLAIRSDPQRSDPIRNKADIRYLSAYPLNDLAIRSEPIRSANWAIRWIH